jgi:predicted  nucleic acid-binding Zn-ribbon protein
MSFPSIPVELMDILHKINDNVNEVKERITRIEAQDHSEAIRSVRLDIEKERNERINLQIELANVKTKLAPIIIGISILATAIMQFLIKHN